MLAGENAEFKVRMRVDIWNDPNITTMKAAKQQLMDFLEWHPLFRSASIGKIMSKLVCYFCPQEIRDRLASECVFSYNGAISYQPPSTSQTPFVSEVPSEDEEPPLALGNEPKNALQYNT